MAITAKDVLEQVDTFGIGPAAMPVVKQALNLMDSWPAELTRERLESAANAMGTRAISTPEWDAKNMLWHFAAIAPVRKKRVVNIWNDGRDLQIKAADWAPFNQSWRKVAGPIEIED